LPTASVMMRTSVLTPTAAMEVRTLVLKVGLHEFFDPGQHLGTGSSQLHQLRGHRLAAFRREFHYCDA
jgi:hypothetical protein